MRHDKERPTTKKRTIPSEPPYVLQTKSLESLNDLSHSILSLTVTPSKTHVKTGGTMCTEEIKLAA